MIFSFFSVSQVTRWMAGPAHVEYNTMLNNGQVQRFLSQRKMPLQAVGASPFQAGRHWCWANIVS